MRKQYDFSAGKKGAVLASPGKTRITIMFDQDLIEHFRSQAEAQGVGYQTLINATLRAAAFPSRSRRAEDKPLTVATLRREMARTIRGRARTAVGSRRRVAW